MKFKLRTSRCWVVGNRHLMSFLRSRPSYKNPFLWIPFTPGYSTSTPMFGACRYFCRCNFCKTGLQENANTSFACPFSTPCWQKCITFQWRCPIFTSFFFCFDQNESSRRPQCMKGYSTFNLMKIKFSFRIGFYCEVKAHEINYFVSCGSGTKHFFCATVQDLGGYRISA